MDLEGFIDARQGRASGASAWCCALPEDVRREIEQVVARGKRNWKAIAAWLVAQGYADATASKVEYHFARGHRLVSG